LQVAQGLVNGVFFSERRLGAIGAIGTNLGDYGPAVESATEYVTPITPLDGVREGDGAAQVQK
jgi:hypothetical protein